LRKRKRSKKKIIELPKDKNLRYCRNCGVLLDNAYFFCSERCQKIYSKGARTDGDWLFVKKVDEDIDLSEFLNQD
jgi:hypothetical protein